MKTPSYFRTVKNNTYYILNQWVLPLKKKEIIEQYNSHLNTVGEVIFNAEKLYANVTQAIHFLRKKGLIESPSRGLYKSTGTFVQTRDTFSDAFVQHGTPVVETPAEVVVETPTESNATFASSLVGCLEAEAKKRFKENQGIKRTSQKRFLKYLEDNGLRLLELNSGVTEVVAFDMTDTPVVETPAVEVVETPAVEVVVETPTVEVVETPAEEGLSREDVRKAIFDKAHFNKGDWKDIAEKVQALNSSEEVVVETPTVEVVETPTVEVVETPAVEVVETPAEVGLLDYYSVSLSDFEKVDIEVTLKSGEVLTEQHSAMINHLEGSTLLLADEEGLVVEVRMDRVSHDHPAISKFIDKVTEDFREAPTLHTKTERFLKLLTVCNHAHGHKNRLAGLLNPCGTTCPIGSVNWRVMEDEVY